MYQVFGMGGMVEELGEVGFEKVEVAGHNCNNIYTDCNRNNRETPCVLELRTQRYIFLLGHYAEKNWDERF